MRHAAERRFASATLASTFVTLPPQIERGPMVLRLSALVGDRMSCFSLDANN
jgi:hypothetical protein